MDRQELCRIVDRAFEINHYYFRSFSLWDWLGLSGFPPEELEEVNEAWLAFPGEGDFENWLQDYSAERHQRYILQRNTVWQALQKHTNIRDFPSIVDLRRAHDQLSE